MSHQLLDPDDRPLGCLDYPCPCLEVRICFALHPALFWDHFCDGQVASEWERAVARCRFGSPPPEGEETALDVEAAWVVSRSRQSNCSQTVGSGRRCAQDGRVRPPKKRHVGVVHGDAVPCLGGDDDDDVSDPIVDDEPDDIHGGVLGGVCSLLLMSDEMASETLPSTIKRGRLGGMNPIFHGKHGHPGQDNVHGCVRNLIVPLGEKSNLTGWYECDGLPRSGEKVALCCDPLCVQTHKHPADPGGLFCRESEMVPDVVKRGVLHTSNACSRMCNECGLVRPNRESMMLCMGCHALTPYIMHSSPATCLVLEERYLNTHMYCDIKCQKLHWSKHCRNCRRDDVRVHACASRAFSTRVRPYGTLLTNGSRMPFLLRARVDQPGAILGWGNS